MTKRFLPLVLLFTLTLVITACRAPTRPPFQTTIPSSSIKASPTTASLIPSATPQAKIIIWLDGTRREGADIYKKFFPEKAAQMEFVEVDRGRFPAEVLRFNQQGKGWPDVVFAEPDLVAQVADAEHDFPLDLKPVLPAEVLNNFEPHAHDACTFGDKLYCLRHDTAPMVLYYNKLLIDQFGYATPATWEEYQALGECLAQEHPGYIVGSFGDAWGFKTYFDASGCPSAWVLNEQQVHINFNDPRCTRAARLVDRLRSNGTLAPYGYFDPSFNQIAKKNKLLMMIGPAWMAIYSFGGKPGSQYYDAAEHQLGVAAPLRWASDPQVMTSAMGGAGWVVSKRTQNLPLALDFITWMVSAPEFWAITPDYPVYVPVQPAWEKAVTANPLFANDPFPAMQSASQAISPLFTAPRFDVMGILGDFVGRALSEKKPFEGYLPDLQVKMTAQAEAAGYQVVTDVK